MVDEAGFKVLGAAGVEMRWFGFGSQDADVEEAGSHSLRLARPRCFASSARQPSLVPGVPSRSPPRQRRAKAGRGDWPSFEPYPQLIAPIVTACDGPTLPFVAIMRRLAA
jgi:hypothetical protein